MNLPIPKVKFKISLHHDQPFQGHEASDLRLYAIFSTDCLSMILYFSQRNRLRQQVREGLRNRLRGKRLNQNYLQLHQVQYNENTSRHTAIKSTWIYIKFKLSFLFLLVSTSNSNRCKEQSLKIIISIIVSECHGFFLHKFKM